MDKYNCGLVSISFRQHSPEEILSEVKNAGLNCVEWGSDVHAPYDNLEKIQEIADLQRKYGISCSSYGTYFRFGKDNISDLPKYVDAAKMLGTDIIRLWCGEKAFELHTDDEKKQIYKDCCEAAKIAEKNNIIFCMECHGWTFTETVEGALELMNTVSSPNFCMYWQPNQYRTVEENIRYAELIEPYCKRIHVFNWVRDNRFPLSDGKSAWTKYLEVFKKVDTLLLEFMPDDRIESLKTEVSALLDIVGRV